MAALPFPVREPPDRDEDSGWRVFAGNETSAYVDDPDNVSLLSLHGLCEIDESLEKVLEEPVGSALERNGMDDEFRLVEDAG